MMRHLVAKVLLATALALGGACSSGDGAPNEGTGGGASGGTTAIGGGSGGATGGDAGADRRRARPAGSENAGPAGGIPALEEQPPVAIRRRVWAGRQRRMAVTGGAGGCGTAEARRRGAGGAATGGRCSGQQHGRLRRRRRAAAGRSRTLRARRMAVPARSCRSVIRSPGASNTSDDGGYRSQLFKLIVSAKQKVTFTGSLTNGPTQVSGQPFPRMHEGHSGWTISQLSPSDPQSPRWTANRTSFCCTSGLTTSVPGTRWAWPHASTRCSTKSRRTGPTRSDRGRADHDGLLPTTTSGTPTTQRSRASSSRTRRKASTSSAWTWHKSRWRTSPPTACIRTIRGTPTWRAFGTPQSKTSCPNDARAITYLAGASHSGPSTFVVSGRIRETSFSICLRAACSRSDGADRQAGETARSPHTAVPRSRTSRTPHAVPERADRAPSRQKSPLTEDEEFVHGNYGSRLVPAPESRRDLGQSFCRRRR